MIYLRPPRVAFVSAEADQIELHLKALPDGEVYAMSGSAALIWLYAVDGYSDVTARVAQAMGLDPKSIEQDVTDFLLRLVEMQLLHPVEAS